MKNKSDNWEESGQVFVHMGKRYGVNAAGRTVMIPAEKPITPFQGMSHGVLNPSPDTLDGPNKISVTKCLVCGAPIVGKRTDKRTCSLKCRKAASRGKQIAMAGIR